MRAMAERDSQLNQLEAGAKQLCWECGGCPCCFNEGPTETKLSPFFCFLILLKASGKSSILWSGRNAANRSVLGVSVQLQHFGSLRGCRYYKLPRGGFHIVSYSIWSPSRICRYCKLQQHPGRAEIVNYSTWSSFYFSELADTEERALSPKNLHLLAW